MAEKKEKRCWVMINRAPVLTRWAAVVVTDKSFNAVNEAPTAKAVLSRPHPSCSGEAQFFVRATARSHPMTSFRRLSLDIWGKNSRPMDLLAEISSLFPLYPTASPAM